jgi:pimeloyl-ACP methyl ester carboxylesterase
MNRARALPLRPRVRARSPLRIAVAATGLALLLAGCSGLLRTAGETQGPTAATALPGGVTVKTAAIRSSTGCQLDYTLYSPARNGSDALVVLGHGFLRSQERMSDLAAAIAADGVPVATLDYCNMRPWSGRHVQNGRDMIALAQALEARHVVYAGFSAGALAALIAGRDDPRAVGIVALDLVDAEGLGQRAARGLDKPLLGLAGEPTSCNADGNGRRVYAASDRAVVHRVEGAGHCDFEAPTDGLCELLCRDPDAPAPSRRPEIVAAATAAVREMLEAG